MLPMSASIVLAMALSVASQTGGVRVAHLEGTATLTDAALTTAGGRAELRLADGTLVQVDAGTSLTWSQLGVLSLHAGRVLIRTAPHAATLLHTPTATVRLWPAGVYSLVVEAAGPRLLLTVAGGEATLETRYGATTRVAAHQTAMMTGATGVPWAAGYVPVAVDGFALWADARLWASGVDASLMVSATGLRPGAPVTIGPGPCGWAVGGWPCGVVPTPTPNASGAQPYAPAYTPNFSPGFAVPPHHAPGVELPARVPPAAAAPPPAPPSPSHTILRGRSSGTVAPRPPGFQ